MITVCAGALAAGVGAQVPLSNEPRHTVVYENADLRILDVNIPPKETTLDHVHDHDIVTVSMGGETTTRTQSPGQAWSEPRPPRALGQATISDYAGQPGSHRVENGRTIPVLVNVVAAESRAFKVYDVRLVRAAPQTSHTHAVPTVVVILAGAVMSDGPGAQAKANAPAPVGLKQLDRPGQWLLVPRGDTHHLVRLGTGDAHVVEIEVR